MKSIKDLVIEHSITSRTLRYYEEVGLICSTKKNNIRYFDKVNIDKIELILILRKINLPLSDIKELLDSFNTENFNKILEANKNLLEDEIKASSKRLYVLNEIQTAINQSTDINGIILDKTRKILNQDEVRQDKVIKVIKHYQENETSQLVDIFDEKINQEKLKDLFNLKIGLNKYQVDITIKNFLSYMNNIVFAHITTDKTFIVRFIFDSNDMIIGIWVDKVF